MKQKPLTSYTTLFPQESINKFFNIDNNANFKNEAEYKYDIKNRN